MASDLDVLAAAVIAAVGCVADISLSRVAVIDRERCRVRGAPYSRPYLRRPDTLWPNRAGPETMET
jgi:hypothetical protein